MSFSDFKKAVEEWFKRAHGNEGAKLDIQRSVDDRAEVTIIRERLTAHEPTPFRIVYATNDALENAQAVIETKMLTKEQRRSELMRADVDDPMSGGLIDDFCTDFTITEDDRTCLERFLPSQYSENRREALLGLMFGTNQKSGPRFTGYAIDGLILHLLGAIEDEDSQYTGHSVLAELRNRGDVEAAAILSLLENNAKWRQMFRLGE